MGKQKFKRFSDLHDRMITDHYAVLSDAQLGRIIGVSAHSIQRRRHRMGLIHPKGKRTIKDIDSNAALYERLRTEIRGIDPSTPSKYVRILKWYRDAQELSNWNAWLESCNIKTDIRRNDRGEYSLYREMEGYLVDILNWRDD